MSKRTVVKRDGTKQELEIAKLRARVDRVADIDPALTNIDRDALVERIVEGLCDDISTVDLDDLVMRTSAARATDHPEHLDLAARVRVSALHRSTPKSFGAATSRLYGDVGLLQERTYEFVQQNRDALNEAIVPSRDYLFSYFGLATLERSYLLRSVDGEEIIETPQYLWMRVAIGICAGGGLPEVLETYEMLSTLQYTHATPTLFNAGTRRPQMSSCFLLPIAEDSIAGIYDTARTCALISKDSGGIGISTHNVRSAGSRIRGSNGRSNGIIPMLRVFNETARYVDQGGKRRGAIAVYLEPWHPDVMAFLELRANQGAEEARCRDLFTAMWIPDLFMKRVEADAEWSLFDPDEARGLCDAWGEEFEAMYERFEQRGMARQTLRAREVWGGILRSQVETGTPYMLYKDACNERSNQRNLGTIRSSNLCTEVVQYSSATETSVCNLASMSLPAFLEWPTQEEYDRAADLDAPEPVPYFNFDRFERAVRVAVRNLNYVIDLNMYPVPSARTSNMRHRPIGLGVQGLADVFASMRMPFDSKESIDLDERIFEAMYHAALAQSCDLAERLGPYETFQGSPASRGLLQFDLWGETAAVIEKYGHDRWESLRARIRRHGLRNSLLVAPMPTASTAQIMGNTESFEPITSNLYSRRTSAGEFAMVNRSLVRELQKRGLWTPSIVTQLQRERGSVADIPKIPASVKDLYKTVWEIRQKWVLDHAAARGKFICQSQSMNVYLEEPTTGALSSMHFYGWRKKLKTGMYYLRTRPRAQTTQFALEEEPAEQEKEEEEKATATPAAAVSNEVCEMCSA